MLISRRLLTPGLRRLVARTETSQINTTDKHQETREDALIVYLG